MWWRRSAAWAWTRPVLFDRKIEDWQAWADVFQDASAFAKLAAAIYAREGLAPPVLKALTPGTNAVFRAGDTVIKLFAPQESGFDSACDFAVETAMLRYAAEAGVATAEALACGEVRDTYLFRYLIMRRVDGMEARFVLPGYTGAEKARFACDMRTMLHKLNRPCPGLLPELDTRARAIHNKRLDALPPLLREDLRTRARAARWNETVIVHGDITGENVLIGADGCPVLIDHADACDAPWFYELPPQVFELFCCDRALVLPFLSGAPLAGFIGALLDGLALHDFGANILRDFAAREGISLADIPTLDALGRLLHNKWEGNCHEATT